MADVGAAIYHRPLPRAPACPCSTGEASRAEDVPPTPGHQRNAHDHALTRQQARHRPGSPCGEVASSAAWSQCMPAAGATHGGATGTMQPQPQPRVDTDVMLWPQLLRRAGSGGKAACSTALDLHGSGKGGGWDSGRRSGGGDRRGSGGDDGCGSGGDAWRNAAHTGYERRTSCAGGGSSGSSNDSGGCLSSGTGHGLGAYAWQSSSPAYGSSSGGSGGRPQGNMGHWHSARAVGSGRPVGGDGGTGGIVLCGMGHPRAMGGASPGCGDGGGSSSRVGDGAWSGTVSPLRAAAHAVAPSVSWSTQPSPSRAPGPLAVHAMGPGPSGMRWKDGERTAGNSQAQAQAPQCAIEGVVADGDAMADMGAGHRQAYAFGDGARGDGARSNAAWNSSGGSSAGGSSSAGHGSAAWNSIGGSSSAGHGSAVLNSVGGAGAGGSSAGGSCVAGGSSTVGSSGGGAVQVRLSGFRVAGSVATQAGGKREQTIAQGSAEVLPFGLGGSKQVQAVAVPCGPTHAPAVAPGGMKPMQGVAAGQHGAVRTPSAHISRICELFEPGTDV